MTTSPNPQGQHNFTILQGASLAISWTLYSDAAQTTAVNITGFTPSAKVRATKKATAVLFDFTPYLTVSGASGKVTLTMTGAQTSVIDFAGAAKWDMTLTSGSSVMRPIGGTVSIDFATTR